MPAITTISDAATLDDVRSNNDVVVVAFLELEDVELYQQFAALAEEMRDNYVFGYIAGDKALAEAENVRLSSVVVYKAVAETKSVHEGPWSVPAVMREFVKTAVQPLMVEFFPETHDQYLEVRYKYIH